ncbi:response regulator [Aquincola sp. J276]|uniref:response regulator n=1 Tax=Aquincola sp. J276 TaxID=2898432 RepID=UPI0021507B4B|nr:response regulator [Aquincola sp. J276]MCR5868169.1 response regulator [Aquincola sp. J276]
MYSPQLDALVVDDDIDCALAVSLLLQTLGCRSMARYGAQAAIASALEVRPELVIVDLALGSEDGCTVMNSICVALPIGHRPMMVCLTGRPEVATETRCLERGFDVFLTVAVDAVREVLAVVTDRQLRRR